MVVVGGGYAGLACLLGLRRTMRDAELLLIDPGSDHLKMTHLHETVRRPLRRFRLPYAQLGQRFGFVHRRGAADLTDVERVAGESSLEIDGDKQGFDHLVIATGARPPVLPKSETVYDRDDLRQQDAGDLVDDFLADGSRPRDVTVIGGGPSGVQFLFELADRFARSNKPVRLRLVDREPVLLAGYPAGIGSYTQQKLSAAGIEYLPQTDYVDCSEHAITLGDSSGAEFTMPSGLTFLFAGVSPSPAVARADRYGRVAGHDNIFAAGDCARYDARGDDAMTAQIAVRQGKLVAQNIDRVSRGVRLLEYSFRELGYVLSLGPIDAVGWLLLKEKVVSGLPAFAIKEVVEAQYDLFVSGLDTYVI